MIFFQVFKEREEKKKKWIPEDLGSYDDTYIQTYFLRGWIAIRENR